MTTPSPIGRTAAEVLAADDSQQEKRDRIIERAIVMFNQVGYDRVRVVDITDSLNIGKGTFYLYFRDKKDLLLRCFDHVDELIRELESLAEIREGDFFAKVRPRVENIGQRDWFPGLVNLLRAAELSPDEEVKSKAREAYDSIADHLRRDLQEAIQTGEARGVDPDLAAYAFIGMAENVWFRSRLDDRYPAERVVNFMADETRHWLSSAGAPTTQRRTGTVVSLVCRDGERFDLTNVRYNGEMTIAAALGRAHLDIEPARLVSLVVHEGDEECRVDVRTKEESEVEVRVAGSLMITGDAALGGVRLALRDLASLTWGEQ
jgi:AcrR family transcriptional regulator